MTVAYRFTSADLDALPDIPGVRYEIIDGDLYVSRKPHTAHQIVVGRIYAALQQWCDATNAGIAVTEPGVVFSDDNDVIPDLIWISTARFPQALDGAGPFRITPELVVEVLSPGRGNEVRDRELKLDLYSRQGVREYWIVDWQHQTIDILRSDGNRLIATGTVGNHDILSSPELPGFSVPVSTLWGPTTS